MPQNLYEFWVVATRQGMHNGLGLTPAETDLHLAYFQRVFHFVNDVPGVFGEWLRLVLLTTTTGNKAHDVRLVAAMLVHGIGHLLTFNPNDFQRFAGIVVQTPADVLGSPLP